MFKPFVYYVSQCRTCRAQLPLSLLSVVSLYSCEVAGRAAGCWQCRTALVRRNSDICRKCLVSSNSKTGSILNRGSRVRPHPSHFTVALSSALAKIILDPVLSWLVLCLVASSAWCHSVPFMQVDLAYTAGKPHLWTGPLALIGVKSLGSAMALLRSAARGHALCWPPHQEHLPVFTLQNHRSTGNSRSYFLFYFSSYLM